MEDADNIICDICVKYREIQPVTKYKMPVKCTLSIMYEYNVTKLQGFSRLL